MGKRLAWSKRAQQDRKDIFDYWNNRNKSKIYSKKLNQLFKNTLLYATEFPQIGKFTNYHVNVHVCIVRDYLLFYENRIDEIIVLSVWYGKQNPEKLNFGEE